MDYHLGILEYRISNMQTSPDMPTRKMNVMTRIRIVTRWLRLQICFDFVAFRLKSLNVTTEIKYLDEISPEAAEDLLLPVKFVFVLELTFETSSTSFPLSLAFIKFMSSIAKISLMFANICRF